MSRIGMERRRSRLNGANGRTFLLAIDHGLPAGPIPGIERPAEFLRRMGSVPFSGLIVNPGLVPFLSNEVSPDWALVVHLSAGTLLSSRPTSKVLGSTVEHAISMGADAVSVQISFGTSDEDRMVMDAGHVVDSTRSFGVPVLMMAYAAAEAGKPSEDAAAAAHAARAAAEIGATFVQTNFVAGADGVRTIVRGCPVPVVVAGGPRTIPENAFLEVLRETLRAGAAGIAVGRQVFQAPDPAVAAHRIADVVFGSDRPVPLEAAR